MRFVAVFGLVLCTVLLASPFKLGKYFSGRETDCTCKVLVKRNLVCPYNLSDLSDVSDRSDRLYGQSLSNEKPGLSETEI